MSILNGRITTFDVQRYSCAIFLVYSGVKMGSGELLLIRMSFAEHTYTRYRASIAITVPLLAYQ